MGWDRCGVMETGKTGSPGMVAVRVLQGKTDAAAGMRYSEKHV
jgi:hypothetical protein